MHWSMPYLAGMSLSKRTQAVPLTSMQFTM